MHLLRATLLLLALATTHLAAAQAPTNPALKGFTALPVRFPLTTNPSAGPFQAAHLKHGGFIESTEFTPFGVAVAYGSKTHNRLRFEVVDGRQQQLAQVHAFADLQLRGNALHNLSGVLFPGRDSTEWQGQNVDAFAGVITLAGQPAGSFWQFAVDNPSQVGGRPLRGEVHNAQVIIRFEEVHDAASYGEAGGMATAMLAAQVQHGFLFLHEGRAVAALELGSPNGFYQQQVPTVLWLKNQLDPNLQLVLTSTALALMARPVLK
jgi:hypothetical protein